MVIKGLLCLSILTFTSAVGYFLATKYRQRKLFFNQLYEFNERFLREISYSKRPLKEFIESYSYKAEFADILSLYIDVLGDFDKIFSIFSEISFLNQEEKKILSDYFSLLGKGDSESQKSYFTSVKSTLDSYKSGAEKEYKKYADLYVKLGVLVGLAIIIIII